MLKKEQKEYLKGEVGHAKRGTDTGRSLACWHRCRCRTRPQPHTRPHLWGTGAIRGLGQGGPESLLPSSHSCPRPGAPELRQVELETSTGPSPRPCVAHRALMTRPDAGRNPGPFLVPKSSGLPILRPFSPNNPPCLPGLHWPQLLWRLLPPFPHCQGSL